MLCSEAIRVNSNFEGGQASVLKCKRWSCPLCHPVQRRRVIRLGREGNPDKFITLTDVLGSHETPDEAAQAMRSNFARLIRIMRKRWPDRTIEYLRVFEATKKGWPHLHILMRAPWIDQKWLSETWKALSGAFIVDVRSVKDKEHAMWYVTKYIGKELGKFAGVTRWFRSKGWNTPKDDNDKPMRFGNHWSKIEGAYHTYAWRKRLELEHLGYVVEQYRVGYMQWRHKLRASP